MDGGKTKNVILLLLLLVNLSFLGILFHDHIEASRHVQSGNEQLVLRLENHGISLDAALIPANRAQDAAFLSRETDVDLSTLLLSDIGLTLAGSPVVNRIRRPDLIYLETRELQNTAIWGEIQRYTMSAPLDVQTAILRLGVFLEEYGFSGELAAVGMAYYFTYGAALIEFRPVWYVQAESMHVSIDRQSGEIRIHHITN